MSEELRAEGEERGAKGKAWREGGIGSYGSDVMGQQASL